jgi:hypothetical protein
MRLPPVRRVEPDVAQPRTHSLLVLEPPIHFRAMPNANDNHAHAFRLNSIDNPIVANPQAVQARSLPLISIESGVSGRRRAIE